MSRTYPSWVAWLACCGVVACSSAPENPSADGVATKSAGQPIISGVPSYEYPEAVVMQSLSPASWCSGAMIAPRVVLTAGHCVLYNGTRWQVRAPYAGGQTANSIDAVSLYSDGGNRNVVNYGSYDLALIFLDRDILVPYPVLTRETFPSGWGLVNVGDSHGGTMGDPLRGDPVAAYNYPGFNYWYTSGANTDRVEPGDSGGPTFVAGTHILVGVNSGGSPGSQEVMMRTDIAVDWLYEQMEIRGLQPSARPAPPWTACPNRDCKFDTLNTNEAIGRGGRLVSSDLKAELDVQSDGNLVLYYNRMAIWASRTGGGVNQLVMQGDGNLVMYNDSGPTWWTGTSGGGLHLSVQADCNLVVYDGAGNARWASNTAGCVNRLFVP